MGGSNFSRWGGNCHFLLQMGGGEMLDALRSPPSHPISEQPGQLQLQMYSCIIYPLNLVQGLIQKF